MKIPGSTQRLMAVLLIGLAFNVAMAGQASLSGLVRDVEGNPLTGVNIKLSSNQQPAAQYHSLSNSSGEYRFDGLPVGVYTLSSEANGYTPGVPIAVRMISLSQPLKVDLTLKSDASESEPHAVTSTQPPPEFQTDGIHGLIDPGGYSASSDGAASGMLSGIAEMKRIDNQSNNSTAIAWPCSLEAELRKAAVEHPNQLEPNRNLGHFYVLHDETESAVPFLKRVLEIDATDYAAARELAIARLNRGEFEAARALLLPLANRHAEPQAEAEVRQLLARTDEAAHMFQQAATQLRAADSKAPSEQNLFNMGYDLMLADSVQEGILAFQSGVQRYPHSIPLRIGLGTAQFLIGRKAEGLSSFLDASDIDPDDSRPYSFLRRVSSLSGEESERVRRSFQRYLNSKPESAEANLFYAEALIGEGAPDDASSIENLLQRAIQLNPNLAEAHLQLGDIYAARKDYQAAVLEYKTAIRLDPDLKEAHYRLAKIYKRLEKPDLSASELHIYLSSRKRPSTEREVAGNNATDLTQFISVMDAPNQRAKLEAQCPVLPQ